MTTSELRTAELLLQSMLGSPGRYALPSSSGEELVRPPGKPPLTAREVMLAAKQLGDSWGDPLGNVDVAAQGALVRLSSDVAAAEDAHAIFDALKARSLRGSPPTKIGKSRRAAQSTRIKSIPRCSSPSSCRLSGF